MLASKIEKLFTVKGDSSLLINSKAKIPQKIGYSRRIRRKIISPVTICGLNPEGQMRVLTACKIIMFAAVIFFVCSFFSDSWVCRVATKHELNDWEKGEMVDKLFCYGLWRACRTSDAVCYDVWKIPGVDYFLTLLVQGTGTVALIFYCLAIFCDYIASIRLFFCIAVNRAVEFIIGCAAVIHFLCVLYFTGHVKNQAFRQQGTRDAAGWGVQVTAVSLTCALTSLTFMAVFRLPPPRHQHRRVWKLPPDLRAPSYSSVTRAAAARLACTASSIVEVKTPGQDGQRERGGGDEMMVKDKDLEAPDSRGGGGGGEPTFYSTFRSVLGAGAPGSDPLCCPATSSTPAGALGAPGSRRQQRAGFRVGSRAPQADVQQPLPHLLYNPRKSARPS